MYYVLLLSLMTCTASIIIMICHAVALAEALRAHTSVNKPLGRRCERMEQKKILYLPLWDAYAEKDLDYCSVLTHHTCTIQTLPALQDVCAHSRCSLPANHTAEGFIHILLSCLGAVCTLLSPCTCLSVCHTCTST